MNNNDKNIRLFIAINFNEEIKDAVYDVLKSFKAYCEKGSFTYRENLHLTVVFIGEIPFYRVDAIKAVMDRIIGEPFTITMKGVGCFRRSGGDIYWIGIEKSPDLVGIYTQLYEGLTKMGFDIEKREYKPHLTLARRVIVKNSFDITQFSKSFSPIIMAVDNIALMKSERIDGKLVYTQIYRKDL